MRIVKVRWIMSKVNDIISIVRSDNLLKAILRKFDSVYAFCQFEKLDYSSVNKYVNQTLKLGDSATRKLERVLGESVGAFDKGVPVKKVEQIPFIKDVMNYKSVVENHEEGFNLIQVNADFITANGWEAPHLCIILLNDESMEPTINEGSQLFIATNQKDIISNKVYAIEYKGRIIVRRIQENLKNNTIILISDAETYNKNNLFKKEELLLDEVKILGRVVFIMGLI